MQCEVCGRQIIGEPQRVLIEGAKMTTCNRCERLGSARCDQEYESLKQTTKDKKTRTVVPSVPLKKRVFVSVPENIDVVESFGSQARKAREQVGLSHEELGRKIGEKVSVIKKIESGKMVPDERLAAKLGHVLKVKLLAPIVEPEAIPKPSAPRMGVTLGEIVQLKGERRRSSENEGNPSA